MSYRAKRRAIVREKSASIVAKSIISLRERKLAGKCYKNIIICLLLFIIYMSISSNKLKYIALIAMTLDHIALVVGQWPLVFLFPEHMIGSYYIIKVFRILGRIAFPLFAFTIAVGCKNTKSMPKYVSRLILFAIVSEIPYRAAIASPNLLAPETLPIILRGLNGIIELRISNVMATLALGAVCIYCWQLLLKRNQIWLKLLIIPTVAIACVIASRSHSDYEWFGVLLIWGLYWADDNNSHRTIVIVSWSIAVYFGISAYGYNGFQWAHSIENAIESLLESILSCSSLLLLSRFTLKRSRKIKWFFYIYYPVHLAILVLLNTFLHIILK
jgi:hypothetical protein